MIVVSVVALDARTALAVMAELLIVGAGAVGGVLRSMVHHMRMLQTVMGGTFISC